VPRINQLKGVAVAENYIEAAFNGIDGSQQAHFFLADHYVTYSWVDDRAINGVHPASDWGVPLSFTPAPTADTSVEPTGIDAALKGRDRFKDFGYIFKGTNYIRCKFAPRGLDGTGALSAWNLPGPGLNTGIDAAFSGRLSRDGKAYLFRNAEYDRYDWPNDAADLTAPSGQPYPRPIAEMVGMPPDFASGLSAAVDGDGTFVNFGYLFRLDQYLRFQWMPVGAGEPHVDGVSAKIHRAWPGLVELLLAGKAKAKALVWVSAAQAGLTTVATGASPLVNAALSTHFHIDPTLPLAAKLPLIAQIQATYTAVTATLASSPTIFRFRTNDEATVLDRMTPVPPAYTIHGKSINFTELFPQNRRMARAAIIVHEAVHFTDAVSGTRTPTGALQIDIPEGYVTPAQAAVLSLPPQADNPQLARRYDLMTTADALHNPSAYAAFPQHVAIGSDTRFGALRQGPE
jgi:hypothetical protein